MTALWLFSTAEASFQRCGPLRGCQERLSLSRAFALKQPQQLKKAASRCRVA